MSRLSPSELEPHNRARAEARAIVLRGWCLWLSQGLWTDATAWSPLLPLLMARPERESWAYSFREVYVPRWLLDIVRLAPRDHRNEADRLVALRRINRVAVRHGRRGLETLVALTRLDANDTVMLAALQALEAP